jgi:uncharacterized protein (TIGR00255 family)
MTGYGRAENVVHGRDITVELRSVNARYFEYSSRLPRTCAFLEDKLKRKTAARISRGKVELGLTIQQVSAADTVIEVDWTLAQSYQEAMRSLAQRLDLKNDLTAGMLAHFPDVLMAKASTVDEDVLWQDVAAVADQALDAFVSMRAVEGEKLKDDLLIKLKNVERDVQEIETNSEGRVKAYTERLTAKLKQILEDRSIDDARILTEAAIFADKTAVDEETVRLHSHIAQYRSILEKTEPIGRKLDFLTQELNREANTIGSKCQDLAITRIVVDLKAEIEKIREQIQNIE